MLGKNLLMGSATQNRIALLIFALSPDAESQQKYVGAKAALYEQLTRHTLKIAEASGIPFFLFTEQEQKGNTFGERYSHAIRQIFALGYEGIITIGNDTPALQTKHLNKAVSHLQKGEAVIGPSFDGGYYLLAIHKSGFSEKEFLSFRWNSSGVFKQMQCYLQSQFGSVIVLDALLDLDSETDVPLLFERYPCLSFDLKKALLQALPKTKQPVAYILPFFTLLVSTRVLNRGSPVLAI